jgi:chitinase
LTDKNLLISIDVAFMTKTNQPIFFSVAFSLLLAACSGNSLQGDSNNPDPQVLVNAGTNASVYEETTVTLNGQASGQSANLTFTWSVSPDITIVHDDKSVAIATFVTPTTSQTLIYQFTLEAVDADGNRGSDSVEYTVLAINEAPRAVISVSQIEGFETNSFPAGVEIILDGSASTDADATDANDPIAAYNWQQSAGISVLQGISTDGDSLAFTSPILDEDSVLSFVLNVSDHEGTQDSQEIILSIQSAANTLPTVNAGVDHEVFSGESILLNGQANSTISESLPLSYFWLNDSELDPDIDDFRALQSFAAAPQVASQQVVTFTLEVTDVFGHNVEDSVSVTIKPILLQPLNDTGVLQQASNSGVFSSHQGDYPGQDGQRGADVIHSNNLLEKAGRGDQGFDFTRLDVFGDEVDDTSLSWSCVRDNVSGLIWEVKTDATNTGLTSIIHSYSWLENVASDTEGDEATMSGDANGALTSCTLNECNTSAYASAVNASGMCNFRDWRLPSHQELLSLVHFGRSVAPMIDPEYFPNSLTGDNQPVWYWTVDGGADGESTDDAQNSWAIDFASGNDNFLNKSAAANIRLVRAGR